jgi:hypothetical protein
MRRMHIRFLLKCSTSLLVMIFSMTPEGICQNQTIPGEVNAPYPTLLNLAFEWQIRGDDNQNGVVSVQYRKKGDTQWLQGMPLRRVPAGENVKFKWENKHSGSIFDLTSGTRYEIKLSLTDPDGGSAERTMDVSTRPEPRVPPGAEIIELAAGAFDTLQTKSGTKDRPVVYQCSEGIAIYKYIDLRNKQWVFIEGLVVDNLEKDGKGIQMNGAQNCVVRHCVVNAVYGIVAYKPGAENCYISDNVITGTSQWSNKAMGADGDNIGEGIEMTGPGNVICYNRVTGFRDCISTMEDSHVVNQTSIDIYNNDIYRGVDDGIEADFCFSNCRIFRNRLTNCYVGLSSQPGLGGPNYFVRNVMYNIIHAAFKLKRLSTGDVVMHNTVIKVGTGLGGNSAMDHAFFRNNLAIGGPTGGINWGNYGAGNPYAADIISPGEHSSFDHDAVGAWQTEYVAKIGEKDFSDVEKQGVEKIRLEDTFVNIPFPYPPIPEREVPDLMLKPGAAAIDGGTRIPNINDDFKGEAPDCGAYEHGQTMPHYGPRNQSSQANNAVKTKSKN